ncbi:conserved hypothetical protein [Candidatus Methylobacter favarea]|uniref:Uncharacterized protein n=1 Tax=Candidatus Methylobacter favarea TaxID=2707345 RepID=A0A8S0Y9X2_9GAMM|nr:hypothetical protein [Candidatus Methylobacter favarea]CAA9890791.1 conserved hypothetical protein [Candidatus Methylobacter favarea]
MNKGPRTAREALIAEALGDLDQLLARVEALPALVSGAETSLTESIKTLEDAGDRYRMAVTAFTEQAKTELTEYLERKTVEVYSKTTEDQRAAMQEAARMAFRSEASDKAADLGKSLRAAAKEFRRSTWIRLFEHAFTAIIASCATVWLINGL